MPAQDPVKTVCNHYFHEHCALKHHAKTGKCFVCEKPTKVSARGPRPDVHESLPSYPIARLFFSSLTLQGIFNVATEITRKVKRMKAAEGEAAAALPPS